jgi:hypothetical protein
VVALLALAFAGCGGGGDSSTDSSSSTPQGMAESANLSGVHSGQAEVALEIDSQSKDGKHEEVNMRIVGPFLGLGEEAVPRSDFAIESNGTLGGRNIETLGGALVDSEYTVVNYEGQTYEPPKDVFEELKSKVEEAQEEGNVGNVMACVEAAEDIELSQLMHNFSSEGQREDVDGTKVTWIVGDLDVPGLIDALIQLSEDPTCGAQLEAAGVPSVAELEAAKKSIEGKIRKTQVQLGVDKHGVFRGLSVDVIATGPKKETIEIEFDYRLNTVNEVTSLPFTHGYAPFEQMLRQVGLDEAKLAEADGGEIVTGIIEGVSGLLTGHGSG